MISKYKINEFFIMRSTLIMVIHRYFKRGTDEPQLNIIHCPIGENVSNKEKLRKGSVAIR